MKTKGALIWDFHQPWSVEEIDIGDPRKGEVKVALEVAGHKVISPSAESTVRTWRATCR